MNATDPRREDRRAEAIRVVNAAGQVWRHGNPMELYRWVSRRNDLLSTIAVATPAAGGRS